MDVALDIAGQGMFYQGTGHIPRSFNSATSFEMDFDLEHWSHPYGGGIGAQTHAVLGPAFKGPGTYQPLQGGEGVVDHASDPVLAAMDDSPHSSGLLTRFVAEVLGD